MTVMPRPTLPPRPALPTRLAAELLGTALLVGVVVGSGIAASRLSPSDAGLQLLENSTATALGLTVLILTLAPVSGAHLNPIVSAADGILRRGRGGLALREVVAYSLAQLAGGVGGAVLVDAMFEVPVALATTDRVSAGRLLGETVATAVLILVLFSLVRTGRAVLAGPTVGAYIGAAYWFTSSTAFANPAVTIGRVFSDTFAGISPASAAAYLGAQLLGGALGVAATVVLFRDRPAPALVRS